MIFVPPDIPGWLMFLLALATVIAGWMCRETKSYLDKRAVEAREDRERRSAEAKEERGLSEKERGRFMEYLLEREKQAGEERKAASAVLDALREGIRQNTDALREHTEHSKTQTRAMMELVAEVSTFRDVVLVQGIAPITKEQRAAMMPDFPPKGEG